MTNELRHRAHVQEVENKIKLLKINWFIKNYEDVNKNPDKPKSTPSIQTVKLVNEIKEMRTEIKDINAKLEKYQKELNAKASDKAADDSRGRPRSETSEEITYMYPVPSDVVLQLNTGISSNEEGRYRYLKTRKMLSPNEKYRACPTHNFKYGWNSKTKGLIGPKYGKTEALTRAMASIHGITLYHVHPTQRPPNSNW